MAEIEIKLSTDQTEISFLTIPRSDIERLAVSPFRWLRYVMFAICGARGDLSTTSNGPAVNYKKTEIGADKNTGFPVSFLFVCDCCSVSQLLQVLVPL